MKRRAEALRADPRVLPQSTLGKAVRYLLNEYTALVGYLRDGRFEIDSNLVENVTQSFGLRFLCRDARNAEKPPQRPPMSKLYLVSKADSLGITAACDYSSAAVFMMGMPFVQRIHPVSDLCCASVMPRGLRGD